MSTNPRAAHKNQILSDDATFKAYVASWDGTKPIGSLLYESPAVTASTLDAILPYTFRTGGIAVVPGQVYIAFLSTSGFFDGELEAVGIGECGPYPSSNCYDEGSLVILFNGNDISSVFTQEWFVDDRLYDAVFVARFAQIDPVAIQEGPAVTYFLPGLLMLLLAYYNCSAKTVARRNLVFTNCLIALFVWPSIANAGFVFTNGFTQQISFPVDFSNSTGLSVAVDSVGNVFASRGFNVTTVPFDGSQSISTGLPFTSNRRIVTALRFGLNDALYAGVLDFDAPVSIWKRTGSDFAQIITLPDPHHVLREMAQDSTGAFYVVGMDDGGDTGWLYKIGANGNPLAAYNLPHQVISVALDSSDRPFFIDFVGTLFTVDFNGTVIPVAQLPGTLVGNGIGYPESMAISDDGIFVGVNLGQRFGANSSVIVRTTLGPNPAFDFLAYGIDVLPLDIVFGPSGELLIAAHVPRVGESNVVKVTGDFSSPFSLTLPTVRLIAEPPSYLIWVSIGLTLWLFALGRWI